MLNFEATTFVKSAVSREGFLLDGIPQFAFAGRSNVGKSSVINSLTRHGGLSRVSTTPGKTAHVNYFSLPDARTKKTGAYLVDLPGYGFARVSGAEKQRWGALMDAYFADNPALRLVVLLVDVRHKPTDDDLMMLSYAKGRYPLTIVANKVDKLRPSERDAALAVLRDTLGSGEILAFSAKNGEGRDSLRAALQARV